MRAIIDIPDAQMQDLAARAAQADRPRAALVRDAIADYLARHRRTREVTGQPIKSPSGSGWVRARTGRCFVLVRSENG